MKRLIQQASPYGTALVEHPTGSLVLHTDHLAAVAEARRAAYEDAAYGYAANAPWGSLDEEYLISLLRDAGFDLEHAGPQEIIAKIGEERRARAEGRVE